MDVEHSAQLFWTIGGGPLSHLAIAGSSGYLTSLIHHPVKHFRTPYEAVPTLWTVGPPVGIAVDLRGPLDQLVELMKLETTRLVPILLIGDIWPASEERPANLMDETWQDKLRGRPFASHVDALLAFAKRFYPPATTDHE